MLFATPGKATGKIENLSQDLEAHVGRDENILEGCYNMFQTFISDIEKIYENPQITFYKFHVLKIILRAADEVCRQEPKYHPELKKTCWVWLKHEENQTDKDIEINESLNKLNRKTVILAQLNINYHELFTQPKGEAEVFLKKWYFWTTLSRIKPLIDAVKTIKHHWKEILRWFESKFFMVSWKGTAIRPKPGMATVSICKGIYLKKLEHSRKIQYQINHLSCEYLIIFWTLLNSISFTLYFKVLPIVKLDNVFSDKHSECLLNLYSEVIREKNK